jgi:deazaflavin-dependent oxidoreductase (nitroreductase family)
MRSAGTAGTQTSVIEHVGRKSGKTYETPVDIIETTTRMLIALPYGVRTDWLRNVLDAGNATVVTRGERIPVGRPAVVATADVAELIPTRTLRTLRLFGVSQCLSLEKS